MSTRILILGGAGMLGHKLVQVLSADFETWATLRGSLSDYERYGIFDSRRTVEKLSVDNLVDVAGALRRIRPTVVINCVGIIKQLSAAGDPIPAITTNALLPHLLHRLAAAEGARLIHFSTDCVFSGRRGMYTENDISDAEDLYGRSKYLGETSGAGAVAIRSSIIGRELQSTSGLVEWFLSNRGGRVAGYRRAIYSGFTTIAMARIVRLLLEHRDFNGLVQVSSEPIDKFSLLELLNRAFATNTDVEPDDSVAIDRSLDSRRFRERTGFAPPSWPEMIDELASDATPYEAWRSEK